MFQPLLDSDPSVKCRDRRALVLRFAGEALKDPSSQLTVILDSRRTSHRFVPPQVESFLEGLKEEGIPLTEPDGLHELEDRPFATMYR